LVAEPRDWPLDQSARGTLRPFHYIAVGYLAVLFENREEAQRAQRRLLERGVAEDDLRLYDGAEILGIASRLQQERSSLAKAINEVVVDHQLRERWLANARAGGAQLWVHAPTKDRADRLVGLLADYPYLLLHYLARTVSRISKEICAEVSVPRTGGPAPALDHPRRWCRFVDGAAMGLLSTAGGGGRCGR
jgi:hypothetical protein